jgi:hypothetical protein
MRNLLMEWCLHGLSTVFQRSAQAKQRKILSRSIPGPYYDDVKYEEGGRKVGLNPGKRNIITMVCERNQRRR